MNILLKKITTIDIDFLSINIINIDLRNLDPCELGFYTLVKPTKMYRFCLQCVEFILQNIVNSAQSYTAL